MQCIEGTQFCAACGTPVPATSNQGEFVQSPQMQFGSEQPQVPDTSVQQQLTYQAISPPEKKNMSTGALVAIVIGIIALFGLCCTIATFGFIGFLDEIANEVNSGSMSDIRPLDVDTLGNNALQDLFDSRAHHYNFAHVDLPTSFFVDPEWIVDEFALAYGTEWQDEFVLNQWNLSGNRLSNDEFMSPDGLAVHVVEDRGLTIVVVTMPPAERVPEAIYVAMVYDREAGTSYYFTLEYSFGDSTMFCAWFANRTRQNFGEGTPAGDIDAFIDRVIEHLN